jgi:hypothetical protein
MRVFSFAVILIVAISLPVARLTVHHAASELLTVHETLLVTFMSPLSPADARDSLRGYTASEGGGRGRVAASCVTVIV